MPPQRTALYRLYDTADVLLYVGITADPETRWHNHALTKSWWSAVARTTVDWRPDRPDAQKAEAAAIRAERPRHNITHSYTEPEDMPLAEACQRFIALVEHVRTQGEAHWITRHGRREAVVVPHDFYVRALAALGLTPVLVGEDGKPLAG